MKQIFELEGKDPEITIVMKDSRTEIKIIDYLDKRIAGGILYFNGETAVLQQVLQTALDLITRKRSDTMPQQPTAPPPTPSTAPSSKPSSSPSPSPHPSPSPK